MGLIWELVGFSGPGGVIDLRVGWIFWSSSDSIEFDMCSGIHNIW